MKNKKKVVYISGPMKGYPELNKPAFMAAEKMLKKKGLLVRNPASIVGWPDSDYRWYLTQAIVMMMKTDRIFMLDGWERSKGSCAESVLADALGIERLDI